jgi:glycosyltransferase involved in cell wall biosynthesis
MKVSILIATKNRVNELLVTLNQVNSFLAEGNVSCVIIDDGSTDGTFEKVKQQFPQIKIHRNEISKGYIIYPLEISFL